MAYGPLSSFPVERRLSVSMFTAGGGGALLWKSPIKPPEHKVTATPILSSLPPSIKSMVPHGFNMGSLQQQELYLGLA